ncbi:hypothetical protein [Streptomyces sp. NPDC048419]
MPVREDFDTAQHHLRGNLPQTVVHALLRETGVRLDAAPVRRTHQTQGN